MLKDTWLFMFNWAETFKKLDEFESSEAVLERVRRMERAYYRVCFWIFVPLTALGGALYVNANHQVGHAGLFIALAGLIATVATGLSTQMSLNLLWTIWESRKRREEELRRSLAEDL